MQQGGDVSIDEVAEAIRAKQARGEPVVMESAVKAAIPEFFDDNKKFLHNIMGNYLIDNYGVCKINGAVHVYDGGVYKPGEEFLHGMMIDLLPTKRKSSSQSS